MRDHPLCLRSLLVALTLATASVASARPFEVPTFPLDPPADVVRPEAAVGTDGTMVIAWQNGGAVLAQRFSQAGATLAPPVGIATGAEPRLGADTRGGYVLAYLRESAGRRRLFGQRLDAAGEPVGAELAIDQETEHDVAMPYVLGLPSGFAFVWQQGTNCWLRRYDPVGAPLADAYVVGDNGFFFPLAATALDDGGVMVVWHDPSVHTFLGRSFNGDGTPRAGPAYLPSIALDVQAIAATPSGGFVAAGVYLSATLRLVEFSPSFTVVGQRDVEVLPVGDTPIPMLARGPGGRWLVVFATAHHDPGYTQLLGYLAPRARPLAADLSPLEPSFALAADPTPRVATAVLPSGSFVNTWATSDGDGAANVASLCTPDVHTCGDGVLDPRCEECDDGLGNDDDAPDACRTSCVLPRCGDGVGDSGEGCDDGTPSPCDGCDATCQPVAGLACGDGIVAPGCSHQCDDGNAIVGDGCAPQCTLERVPGGGARTTDCYAEWIVANPSNLPLLDGQGRLRRTQRCSDDDPACDFDGGTPGTCTFQVRVCANNTDVPGCTPTASLTALTLAKPSSNQAAHHPELAAVRAAFAGVPASVIGTSAADLCSAVVPVVVPLRGSAPSYGKGALTLATVATAVGGGRDKDALKLICLPQ